MKFKKINKVRISGKLNKKKMTVAENSLNGSATTTLADRLPPIHDEGMEEDEEYSEADIEDESDVDDEISGDDLPEEALKRKHIEEGEPKSSKKNKLSEANLTKPPTAKELNQLRETENLFHSNLFRLQIEEMLKEMKLKSKYNVLLNKWIDSLTSLLSNMKTPKKYLLSDERWLKKLGIELPIVENVLRKSTDAKPDICCIKRPRNIAVIGSYSSHCFMGPKVTVDVQIEMPKECISKDDELNYAYHAKRAVYLGYVAHILQTSDIAEEVYFSQSHASFSPILEVKPSGKLAKIALIRLYVTVEPSTFKLNRFSPSKSKISSNLYFNELEKKVNPVNSPTPHYNSSVLQDLTMTANEEFRNKIISSHPNLQDGITLLKVWLRQRQLDVGYGAFSGYMMSMFVVYLFQARRLNNMMSSYQVARNVWNAIAQSDWCTNGITLSKSPAENQPPLTEFHQHFDVVFVDVTGFLNLCSEVSKETFLQVKKESILAMQCLDNPNVNSFQALFLTPKPLHLQCDHILRFQDPVVTKLAKKKSPVEKQMDYGKHFYPQTLSLILESLRCGLEKRVSLLCIKPPDVLHWPVTEKPPVQSAPITLGLVLDSDHAFNVLQKGPEANVQEAEQFRAYWGDKCELRRFRDGSISEMVVWEKSDAPASKKRLITRQIVSYLLTLKLGLSEDDFVYLADQFEPLLNSIKGQPTEFHYGTGEEASFQVVKAFDSLVKLLRLLPDMPLDVSSVQGASAVFRYADVFPPLARNYWVKKSAKDVLRKKEDKCVMIQEDKMKGAPNWVQPINGVIQLGLSSKWPDDLDAIRRIQAAFYVSIAKQLTEHHGLTSQAHADHFDVLSNGFVFRFQLCNQREIAMLKKSTTLDGSTKFRDTVESIELEKKVDYMPKVTGALLGVHQRFTSFGPACCLSKRWLRSQLLDEDHFPDICIELLVALLYIQPQPFTPPNQPQTAFFRFLRLLALTNWHSECLVLNFNEELTRDEILQIEGTFNSTRSTLPALFIATPFDRSGSLWTKSAPSLQIMIRVAQLANEALNILSTCFFTAATTVVNVNQLFLPTTDVYDVTIRLHGHMTPRLNEAIPKTGDRKTHAVAPYVHRKGEKIPVTGFDPVQCYLKQLREAYSAFALFFHDPYGGDCIGVLWKPSTHDVKEFKVSQVHGRKLTNRSKLIANLDAIIEDFYIMGEELVLTIETKNSSAESV